MLPAWSTLAPAAMIVREFDADIHDRFDTDRQGDTFLADPWNLSGVGRSSNGTWGTLVSPTIFVSANHYHPNSGNLLRFYHTNDPAGAYEERTVTNGRRIAYNTSTSEIKTDIWVGELDAPVSSAVNSYTIADQLFQGQYLLNVGRTGGGGYTSQRVGDNMLTDAFTMTQEPYVKNGWVFTFTYDDPETGGNPDETWQQSGDSGGPTFVDVNGELHILGVHFGIVDEDPAKASDGDLSADSLLAPYKDRILGVSVIPEPGTALLLGLTGLAYLLLNRNSSRRS